MHGFLPVPGRRQRRYYGTSTSSFPGPYTVPPGLTSITMEKASEVRKRSVSLSASQVSSLETMLSGMCEVSSWMDWWLSTCGGFRDLLPLESRADFERLMMSGSRSLEFLASQGCTALGNLVLSRRDALLADVRGTVPVEEVARLRYSPLPLSASIFPHTLLDSALLKMRAAASDALVQRTLHPPRIPRKPVTAGQGSGSSASRSGQASTSGAAQAQKQSAPFLLPVSLARGRRRARVRLPFPLPLEAPAAREVKEKVPGRSQPDGVALPMSVGGCLSSHWRRWQEIGAETWVVSGRLPCPVQGLSSSPSSHTGIVSDVPGRLSSGSSLAARGRGDACQRSLRNRPRSGSRLLQSSLPGGEGDCRLETCDRSLAFERLRPADAVQDGNSRFGAVVCQRGGFSSFLGSEGCVLSDPDPWIIEEAVEVHVGGDSLPVQSPVLRSVDCSPGLYQSLRGGVGLGSRSRYPTAPLPGRLVGPLLLGEEGQGVDQGAPLALSHPRDCDKREEVGSRALAVCEVSRYDHRYRCRQGLPVSCESREVPYGSGEILFHAISPSSALAGDLGSPGFAGAVGSSRSTSDALLAVASEVPVVPRVRPSLASGGFAGGSETGPVLVDGEGSPVSGGSIRDTCSGSTPVFGRVFVGLGCSPPRSKRVRSVVRPGEVVAHQSSRNEGPVPGPSSLSRSCLRSPCDRDVRQLHGCGVRQQTGGHGVEASVFVDQPPSEMGGVFRRPSRSEVSSRRVQRPGRCTQPSRASCRDRVVSPPSGGESTSSYVG